MRNTVIKGLIVGVLVLFSLVAIGRLDNVFPMGNHNVQRIKLAAEFDHLDFLFIGGSYVYSGIVPAQFEALGYRAYALGAATAGPHFFEVLATDYLKSCSAPKNIVFNLTPISFSQRVDDWERYAIHRHLVHPLSNWEVATNFGPLRMLPQLLINSYQHALIRLFDWLRGTTSVGNPAAIYAARGFKPDDRIYSDDVYAKTKHHFEPMRQQTFNQAKARRLLAFAQKLQESGIHVIFQEFPSNRLNEFFSQAFLQDYERHVHDLRRAGYLVLRNDLELPEKYFRDIAHLNTQGAEVYTAHLIRKLRLRDRGLLPVPKTCRDSAPNDA